MSDPRQFGAERSRVVLDHGEVVELDGGTLVWVPNWSSMSCDLGVFVDQSSEPVAASDAERGR
jgi:hypothetical protein